MKKSQDNAGEKKKRSDPFAFKPKTD